MTIDISGATVQAYECVFAALLVNLVSDWNMRAWTLLEAMRGKHGLFISCLHNQPSNLHELMKSVHDRGRMDISCLILTRGYLLPPPARADFEIFPGQGPVGGPHEIEMKEGFVSIGEVVALLSHRHATRDGDELLIWSLLIGEIEDESPIELWRRQVGKKIKTGVLVSSAQRVAGQTGLG